MLKVIETIKTIDEIEPLLLKSIESNYFSEKELKQCENKNKPRSLGARYLIKKSILEIFNLENDLHNIEILNNDHGKPEFFASGKVKEKIEMSSIKNIQISISHSRNYISTLVILE